MADEQIRVYSGAVFQLAADGDKAFSPFDLLGVDSLQPLSCTTPESKRESTIKQVVSVARSTHSMRCTQKAESIYEDGIVSDGHPYSCTPSHAIINGNIVFNKEANKYVVDGIRYPFADVEGDIDATVENGLAAFRQACADVAAQKQTEPGIRL